MRRVLCVWFPNWPIQQLRQAHPRLRQRPLVVFAEAGGRGLRVAACSAEAAEHGVVPGLPLAEARALLHRPREKATAAWQRADPAADRQALQALAGVCQRYTPFVGLEEGPEPQALFLDVAGCAHLCGDERGLLATLTRDLTQQGFEIRPALADTLGTAWAVAHAGPAGRIVPAGECRAALERLPVAALRIEAGVVETLRRLDVRTIGELLRLPRGALPARFGKELIRRIDQACGTAWETFVPERFTSPPSARWSGDDPLTSQQAVVYVFRQLLSELLPELARQRAGVLDLCCELHAERGRVTLPIRLSQPTTDERHLGQLFELSCERQAWPGGVGEFRLEITRAGWLTERQTTLFEDEHVRSERDLTRLVERLTSRLGEQAVLQAVPVADPLPEWAVQLVPWLHEPAPAPEPPAPEPRLTRTRPWRMLAAPQPVEVTSVVPDGPPLRLTWRGRQWNVVQAWGPERIESGWWRARDVRRDYYRVETEHGLHGWLFRRRDDGAWFLHGLFD